MKEEQFFLVNNFLEKERKELENIIEVVQGKNAKKIEKAVFIRNFTNELFKAYRKTKKSKIEIKTETLKEKEDLLRKKQEILNKLQELQQNLQTPQVIKPQESKDIILSKETGKALVRTEFDGTHYSIFEPELTKSDISLLEEVKRSLNKVNLEDKQKLIILIKNLCAKYAIDYSDDYYDKIRYYVVRDVKKFWKLSPLIEDQDVSEIVCNGINKPITVRYKEKEDLATNIIFTSEDELNKFLQVILKKANQKVSVENPFLNITLGNINLQGTIGSEFVKAKFVITKI